MMKKTILAAGLTLSLSLTAGVAFAQAGAAKAKFTSMNTMGELLADPGAKAVLMKEIPEIAGNPQMDQAKTMSLRSLQQFAPMLDDEKLAAIDAELAKLGPAKKK